jgi:hypothetical protein
MKGQQLSLRIVHGDLDNPFARDILCKFALGILQKDIDFGPCMALGVVSKSDILGTVIFHDYVKSRGTIEMSIAAKSRKWLTRNVVKEIARLAFITNNCQMLYARCDGDDQTTDRILSALGFNKTVIPNMRGKNKSEHLFQMTKDNWFVSRFAK